MAEKRGHAEKIEGHKNHEALGVAGFTLGIMSFVMLLLSPLFGILTALVGGILCFKQMKKSKTQKAKTGLILNIIGLVVNIAFWVIMAVYLYPLLQSRLTGLPV